MNFTFTQADGSKVDIEATSIEAANERFKKNYTKPEKKGGVKSKSKKTNED